MERQRKVWERIDRHREELLAEWGGVPLTEEEFYAILDKGHNGGEWDPYEDDPELPAVAW